jgi:XTP/dITP diphosphohydrolase
VIILTREGPGIRQWLAADAWFLVPNLMRVLVATSNPGKIREIRRVLDGAPVTLITPQELGASTSSLPPPEETGRTFAENARAKASYYAEATGLATVAEDSGLVIDALGGRPGVESARYPGATYPDKFRNLYRELAGHARPWTARFVCSVAFVEPAHGQRPEAQEGPPWETGHGPWACSVPFTCEAAVEGEIAPDPRGTHGFGYDPIFFYPPYGSTLGEVTDERKLAVAHRGKAFREFRAWIEARINVERRRSDFEV